MSKPLLHPWKYGRNTRTVLRPTPSKTCSKIATNAETFSPGNPQYLADVWCGAQPRDITAAIRCDYAPMYVGPVGAHVVLVAFRAAKLLVFRREPRAGTVRHRYAAAASATVDPESRGVQIHVGIDGLIAARVAAGLRVALTIRITRAPAHRARRAFEATRRRYRLKRRGYRRRAMGRNERGALDLAAEFPGRGREGKRCVS